MYSFGSSKGMEREQNKVKGDGNTNNNYYFLLSAWFNNGSWTKHGLYVISFYEYNPTYNA